MAITRDQGISISLSAMLTWLPLIPVLWFIARPIIAEAVAEELKQSFEQKIESEAAPIKGAFTVLILRDMAYVRRAIAQMEFRRDNPPDGDWDQNDAQELVNMRLELESLQDALQALRMPVGP